MKTHKPEQQSSTHPNTESYYDGPPDYRVVGQHAVFPKTRHDETERYNFLAHLNRHLASQVMPGVKTAFEAEVEPAFAKAKNRPPENRHEVRKALQQNSIYQTWSALRRNTMEMRQQNGRAIVLRQLEQLNSTAKSIPVSLKLDPSLEIPNYLTGVDHHCMPGSYYSELTNHDVAAGANYDSGMFATTGGALGRFTDGGGQAVVHWLSQNLPDWQPKRILDLGCGIGHNVVPIAQAFPNAELVAVDAGAPMLRYAAARASSMGCNNIHFIQADVADLSQLKTASFDWIQSTMFLHETSYKALRKILQETYRLLAPGGIVLHVEQPQYDKNMPLFEQAMRDWDAFNNNEPFWTKMHEIDLDQFMLDAGFTSKQLMHGAVTAVVDNTLFPDAATDEVEDYGRKPAWHLIGAQKS